MTGVDTGVTEVRGQLRTNWDSALGSIHEVCKGLAEIGEGKLEKQIILILTHGHRKVAVFFIWRTDIFPGNPERYKQPGLRTSRGTNYSTSRAPGIRHGDA